MSERVRVYHPVTDEPFDLPVQKANDLILNEGWRKHPIDPNAEAAVKTIDTPIEQDIQDWRENVASDEASDEDED